MNSNPNGTGARFAAALKHRFETIDSAHPRNERRDEYISAAFFQILQEHYPAPEPAVQPPVSTTRHRRQRPVLHHRVILITGAETMLVKRGRQQFEVGLCSVRVPVSSQDQIAAALCELLQFERVKIRICCRDRNGLLRGVIEKVDPVPALAGKTVNETLIAAGFGQVEVGCRRCETGDPVPESAARDRLERLLVGVNEQADRRFLYLMQ